MHIYQGFQSPRELRLLELHPGSVEDVISVSLHTRRIEDEPLYEALSYVWGDPSITRTIECNGAKMDITLNLHCALVDFRLPDKSRILWADAICIDQGNLGERASQVQIMHLIYKNCSRCLVWLGPGDEHFTAAREIMKSLTAIICERLSLPEDELDAHLVKNGRDMQQAREIGFNGLPSPDSRAWGSLMHFFGRAWFSRVWVIQEAYFSPEVRFFCGGHVQSFASMFYTADWILTNGQHISWAINWDLVQHYSKSAATNVMAMQSDDYTREHQALESLLGHCKNFNATDPRDKVYALMNLPPFQREYPDLIPDYHLSTQDVFADVTVALIRHQKSLSVLTGVDYDPNNPDEPFPSWVPRWQRSDAKPNVSSMWYKFFSAGITSDTPQLSIQTLPGHVLPLSGFEIDTIRDVCTIARPPRRGAQPAKPTFTPAQAWSPYPRSSEGPYKSEAEIITAFAMTFTAMCRENNGVFALHCSPENYAHHASDFVAWLQWLRSEEGVKNGHYPPGLYSEEKPFLLDTNQEEAGEFAMRYHKMVASYVLGRKLIRTSKGYLGLGWHALQAGDKVCIAFGGALPLILRPRIEGGYTLIGDAYIHGIMKGEAMELQQQHGISNQLFHIH